MNESGEILSLAAHERAGTPHAEAKVIAALSTPEENLKRIHTLFITLEPCNHHGRTPPCTEAILKVFRHSPKVQVIYGVADPNPKVEGGGAARLKAAGVWIEPLEKRVLPNDPLLVGCRELIGPFAKHSKTGIPWVTVKTVWNEEGSMIPPAGRKTFSSPASLKLAHELRKRADAIVTGSGTVLADSPEFTVRHVADHPPNPQKKRILTVLDRNNRVSPDWYAARSAQGFEILACPPEMSFPEFLQVLGRRGVLEVLVEAGPTLSGFVLSQGLWDEHIRIDVRSAKSKEDQVTRKFRELCSPASSNP